MHARVEPTRPIAAFRMLNRGPIQKTLRGNGTPERAFDALARSSELESPPTTAIRETLELVLHANVELATNGTTVVQWVVADSTISQRIQWWDLVHQVLD